MRPIAGAVAAMVVVLAATGCSRPDGRPGEAPTGADQPPSPSTSSAAPATPTRPATEPPRPTPDDEPAYSTWPLGERALPLRADGYGEIRPTPPSLRDRRYPTTDTLPPPAGGRFASSVESITPEVRRRMGRTWSSSCPVRLEDLRYVRVAFRGFDGAAHTGELVVAASQAAPIVSVFRRLYRAGYPIEEMRLPTTADLDAPPTGDTNNTSAYVCRPTTGQTSGFSEHAYGLAIDVNPFLNPYVKGELVVPERASAYLDRARRRPGMIEPDDLVVRAFAAIGWEWGGDYQSLKDYQHFSETGR